MATKISYDDFEPLCEWRREESQDILQVYLEGFKKDKLRVQINTDGLLTISGERSLDENRRSRFCKKINLSKDLKVGDIHAKFSGGILYITLLKTTSSSETPHDQPTPAQRNQQNESSKQSINYRDKETNGLGFKDSGGQIKKDDNNAALGTTITNPTECAAGMTSSVTGLKMSGKTALKLGAVTAVVVVVSVGAFVAYKYRRAFQIED